VAKAADPAAAPLLFEAAAATQEPGFAVRAGEVANALDPKAAVRAWEAGRRKLRRIGLVNAVRFLGEIKTPAAAAALEEMTKSKELEARVEALYGLVKQGDPALRHHLVAALKSLETDVRVPAAICCGLAKASSAIDVLMAGLEDADADFAFFCAWALGQMKDPKLLPRVVSAARGRMSGAVGVAKAKAVLECAFDAQAHVPVLVGLLGSTDELLAGAAAGALARIGEVGAEAADAVLALALQARSDALSQLAVDALGRIGGTAQGERILARYENNAGAIPAHMVKALGLLKTAKAAGLLQHLAYSHKDAPLRKRACIAFWQCADETARKELQARLDAATQDAAMRNGCLLLGFDRSDDGFRFALTLLRKHHGRKTLEHVRETLERMTGHRFGAHTPTWLEWYGRNPDFFTRKPELLDRDAWRKQVLEAKEELGISRLTEEAVERGLGWLARHQSLDGRWSGDRFFDRCELFYGKSCQIGARLGDWDLGMTGISLLAFYGAGYRPDQGRYKDNVLRAQVYCAARQWADGDFGGQGDLIGGYTRPIATIALAEAYGTAADPEYLERAARSVAQIIRIQYPDAGWRYRLSGQFPGDTSVTGWNAWAIATARKFGVAVDPMGIEGANSLIDSFSSIVTQDEEFYDTDPKYFFEVGRGQKFEHFTGYNARDATRPPMTALGLVCKILMDRRRSHPFCIGAANTLLKNVPEYDERANKIKYATGAEYPVYYYYYGSLAMYQMGGSFWRKWSRPLLTEGLPNTQIKGNVCERGSWPVDNLDSIGGRVYVTAMGVLTLETFYRYLPVLQGR
ncbi:MAG: HEAT repeat domain-containing protein, partial [Planctomycetota bacterium]